MEDFVGKVIFITCCCFVFIVFIVYLVCIYFTQKKYDKELFEILKG